jgi:hypothetical protein
MINKKNEIDKIVRMASAQDLRLSTLGEIASSIRSISAGKRSVPRKLWAVFFAQLEEAAGAADLMRSAAVDLRRDVEAEKDFSGLLQ